MGIDSHLRIRNSGWRNIRNSRWQKISCSFHFLSDINFQFQLFAQAKIINDGMTLALKNIGALETTVGCYTYHDDMLIMERSFCTDGM